MNPDDARVLFDECLPLPFFVRLIEFLNLKAGEGPTVRHLFDLAPSGTFDEDWLPLIKDEGWTVISADGGRKPNKRRGKKLPHLCLEFGVTLIMLSPVVHNRKAFDKTRTIMSVWERIVEIATDRSKRGRRYMLEPLNQENPGVGRIVERPIHPRRTGDSEKA